jgi:hypothetical protein
MDAKEPLRSCSRVDQSKVRRKLEGGRRQICIPMTRDQYHAIWSDPAKVRSVLLQNIAANPELFPANIAEGFSLTGMLPESSKQPGVRLRQLVTRDNTKWYLRPSFVTAYMTAQTQDLDCPLLLISLGVPLWAQRSNWPNSCRSIWLLTIVLCFLHGFLKVRDRCFKEYELHKKIREVHDATSGADFRKRTDEFKTWFSARTWKAYVVEMTSKLWKRTEEYSVAYDQPGCYRTSNQIDRPMNRIKRILYSGRGLHGHRVSSERHLRGVALLNNFRPFAPRPNRQSESQCPAHRLSGKLYSTAWVENLLLAASMNGYKNTPGKR